MKDRTLLKLSLSVSLLGLMVLLAMTEFIEPSAKTITNAKERLGDYVYVEGNINRLTVKEDFTFLELEDSTSKIPVVAFEKLDGISKGDLVGVAGEVSLYKGEEEIIADEIICLRCGV